MFGDAKKWAERNVAIKNCKACPRSFQPSCGGNLYCPECGVEAARAAHAKNTREYRARNPLRHQRLKANWDLKRFGMTLEDYEQRLRDQKYACAICGTTSPKGRGIHRLFAVDHCHQTNKVRKLLCHRCNGALGMVSDDISILGRMISYLKEHANV